MVINNQQRLDREIQKRRDLLTRFAPPTRLSLYVQDKALQQLSELSIKGMKLGLRRYNEGIQIDELIARTNIMKMAILLQSVKEFNVFRANGIYGDGVLDYNYASGKSDDFSLRLGHQINREDRGREI